ncbi:GNAT family N-acetyltransferase [Companilactobacillus furfuricola]|uniref:GNAT family N-acetyltransferase n=1 Tax=Companilactobacillus furfuricola TaxID=1462575 RepID=UPI000F767F58|nr:GNAT family N-acetyltransferase [Companilactobacillus furfuricola]
MNLIGNEVEIRNFEQNDYLEFAKLVKDPNDHDSAGLEYSLDDNEIINIFNKYLSLANSYVIALKSSHRMLGIIELNERGISNGLDKTREIGFVISNESRRQGYASEAIELMLEYAFNELHLLEVWAAVKVNNTVPQLVLTKLGFKYIYQVSQDPFDFNSAENTLKYYLLKNDKGN